MIYEVIGKKEVTILSEELKLGFPGTAKIYYVLRNYLQGILQGFEVLVDSWPNWKCIILRPDTEEVPGYFKDFYICYGKSVASLKYFLQRPGVINWNQPATFTGVPHDVLPVLQEVCRKRGGHLPYIEPRFMYCWSAKPPRKPSVPNGVKLTTLSAEHAEQLRCDWKDVRGDSALKTYFSQVIEHFDSSAIVSDKNELLAYICMQFNGSMAMLHVQKEHRGNGYGEILLQDMTHKLASKNEIPYGFVPTKDLFGIQKAQTLGYTWIPQGNMVWVRYLPTPRPIQTVSYDLESAEHLTSTEDQEPPIFINAIPLAINKTSQAQNCFN